MGYCMNTLQNSDSLNCRNADSAKRLNEIREEIKRYPSLELLSIYVVGSIGRGDVGQQSDLDLFLMANNSDTVNEQTIQKNLAKICQELGYTDCYDNNHPLVHQLPDMLDKLGAPADDNLNLFTARMLLLLESQCVSEKTIAYEQMIDDIISHYLRDGRGKKSFRPLFLLNDILRYWRTLCLNYELIRDDTSRPFHKKNINLKFSRMLTIFGTVLPIMAKPQIGKDELIELTKLSPHARFAQGLDDLNEEGLNQGYSKFLEQYEYFLKYKEKLNHATNPDTREDIKEIAEDFAEYIYQALTHQKIDKKMRRFLIL